MTSAHSVTDRTVVLPRTRSLVANGYLRFSSGSCWTGRFDVWLDRARRRGWRDTLYLPRCCSLLSASTCGIVNLAALAFCCTIYSWAFFAPLCPALARFLAWLRFYSPAHHLRHINVLYFFSRHNIAPLCVLFPVLWRCSLVSAITGGTNKCVRVLDLCCFFLAVCCGADATQLILPLSAASNTHFSSKRFRRLLLLWRMITNNGLLLLARNGRLVPSVPIAIRRRCSFAWAGVACKTGR